MKVLWFIWTFILWVRTHQSVDSGKMWLSYENTANKHKPTAKYYKIWSLTCGKLCILFFILGIILYLHDIISAWTPARHSDKRVFSSNKLNKKKKTKKCYGSKSISCRSRRHIMYRICLIEINFPWRLDSKICNKLSTSNSRHISCYLAEIRAKVIDQIFERILSCSRRHGPLCRLYENNDFSHEYKFVQL